MGQIKIDIYSLILILWYDLNSTRYIITYIFLNLIRTQYKFKELEIVVKVDPI